MNEELSEKRRLELKVLIAFGLVIVIFLSFLTWEGVTERQEKEQERKRQDAIAAQEKLERPLREAREAADEARLQHMRDYVATVTRKDPKAHGRDGQAGPDSNARFLKSSNIPCTFQNQIGPADKISHKMVNNYPETYYMYHVQRQDVQFECFGNPGRAIARIDIDGESISLDFWRGPYYPLQ